MGKKFGKLVWRSGQINLFLITIRLTWLFMVGVTVWMVSIFNYTSVLLYFLYIPFILFFIFFYTLIYFKFFTNVLKVYEKGIVVRKTKLYYSIRRIFIPFEQIKDVALIYGDVDLIFKIFLTGNEIIELDGTYFSKQKEGLQIIREKIKSLDINH